MVSTSSLSLGALQLAVQVMTRAPGTSEEEGRRRHMALEARALALRALSPKTHPRRQNHWALEAYQLAGQAIGIGSLPPPPHGDLYFYADIPNSYDVDGAGVVSRWGTADVVAGDTYLITDSVTGQKAIRFGAGTTLTTAVGAADFLTEDDSTSIVVCRTRHPLYSPAFGALDTSGNGTGNGFQLQFNQVAGQKLIPRMHDASTWILDEIGTEHGQFIDQKWFIACVRISDTNLSVRFDGQFTVVGGTSLSLTFPGATGRGLSIGNGPVDILAIELYASRLSDEAIVAAEVRLSNRFSIDMLQVIGGDPTLTTDVSALFPYMSALPSGKLYVTMFRGSDESPHDSNYITDRVSSDHGAHWTDEQTILQSDSVIRYSDVHTSEPLSDGTVFQHWFIYDSNGNTQTKLQWRKSTGFNIDGYPIWGSTVDLPMAGVDWVASGAQMVEDPFNAGNYHLPAFALQTGHANENIYDIQSTNSASSWSFVKVADGDTDSRRYAENAFEFDSAGVIFCMTRVVGAAQAYETHSTNNGSTWATPVASNATFLSSAQGFRKLASGAYIAGPARTNGSFQESSMFWRAPGTAWNDPWTSPPNTPYVDPFFGGNYYGGNYEYSPGVLAMVFGRSSSNNNRNNVSTRTNFYEWYLTHEMPGDAVPNAFALTSGEEQVLALSGAGDYTAVFDDNQSGATITIAGEFATYTAGVSNGVDTFHFLDTNSKEIGSVMATVTGGVSGPIVSSITPDAGIAGMPVTVSGSGFTGSSSTEVGGVALTSFVVVNGTTITGVLGPHATAGGLDVVVTNGTTGTLTAAFTYLPSSLIMYRRGDAISFAPYVGWLDLTTNGNDAAGPPGFDPTPTIVAGKAAVHFSGGGDRMSYATFTAGLTALDYFVLAQNDDDGVTSMGVSTYTDDVAQSNFTPLSNRQLYVGIGSDSRNTTGFAPAAGGWSSPWLMEVVADTNYDVNFNGVAVFGPVSNTFGYTAVQKLGGGGTNTYTGAVVQEMMFSARLSGPDRTVVTIYLMAYGSIA